MPLRGAVLQPADPETRVGAVLGTLPGRGEGLGHPHERAPESWAVHHRVLGRSGQRAGVQVRGSVEEVAP